MVQRANCRLNTYLCLPISLVQEVRVNRNLLNCGPESSYHSNLDSAADSTLSILLILSCTVGTCPLFKIFGKIVSSQLRPTCSKPGVLSEIVQG
jgi:hypothetical protein